MYTELVEHVLYMFFSVVLIYGLLLLETYSKQDTPTFYIVSFFCFFFQLAIDLTYQQAVFASGKTIVLDDLRVERGGCFGFPGSGRVAEVDEVKAEPLGVATRPLVVVHQ